MRKINLQLNNTKIPILVGSNILKTINPENYVKKNDVVIITNSTIARYNFAMVEFVIITTSFFLT